MRNKREKLNDSLRDAVRVLDTAQNKVNKITSDLHKEVAENLVGRCWRLEGSEHVRGFRGERLIFLAAGVTDEVHLAGLLITTNPDSPTVVLTPKAYSMEELEKWENASILKFESLLESIGNKMYFRKGIGSL